VAGGAQAVGETGGELLAPAAHRLIGDDDTTLGQDQLNIPQAEAEHMVQLDTVADDLSREPMTVMRIGRWHHIPVSPATAAAAKPDCRDNALSGNLSTNRPDRIRPLLLRR